MLRRRVGALRAGLEVHQALSAACGSHRHNLGCAIRDARAGGLLSREQCAAARQVQRAANRARHEPFGELGAAPETDAQEGLAGAEALSVESAVEEPGHVPLEKSRLVA